VGEWLRYAATPLERRNFEELLNMLEDFEYERGLQRRQPSQSHNGVIVSLGPLLHAKLTFHVTRP
jgi:hypothetical protein